MKTFNFNQDCSEDDEVYCINHVPKVSPGKLDGDSLGIQTALNVPKSVTLVNEQIRPPETAKGRLSVECLEDSAVVLNNQSILTCDNLEILHDENDGPDFKIEKHSDDDATSSPSISSGTSSLSSVILSSSSSSVDEIHFQMSHQPKLIESLDEPIPQKFDAMPPFADGAVMIEQENEELDLNENLDVKVVVATKKQGRASLMATPPEIVPPPKNILSFEDIYCQTLMKLPIGWIDATEVLEKESTKNQDDDDDDQQ